MKKRLLSLLLILSLCMSFCAVTAFAADSSEAPEVSSSAAPEPVYANLFIIYNDGNLVFDGTGMYTYDADEDGVITINDILLCAHESYYNEADESDTGYAYAVSEEYGAYITKLWGVENGGAYGYYVNDKSAWSLTDPIKDGDKVVAFIYSDTTGYSDQYTYFDQVDYDTYRGKPLVTVQLKTVGYDADWNPVSLPLAGATITVDGEATSFVTDKDGKVTITLSDASDSLYLLSAESEQTIVPPYAWLYISSFSDTCGHWASYEIEQMAAAGLMQGNGGRFEPKANLTRGQLVTVLHRLGGELPIPDSIAAVAFTDVPEGAFYAEAVKWAATLGYVNGVSDTKFAPNATVTRAEMATILYRMAKSMGFDTSIGENTNILSYDDAFDIPEWAIPAMQWACGTGLISGVTESTLAPNAPVSRAQAAVMLCRFSEYITEVVLNFILENQDALTDLFAGLGDLLGSFLDQTGWSGGMFDSLSIA